MMMYELLNVNFDSYDGESFFNNKMAEVVDMLEAKKLISRRRWGNDCKTRTTATSIN